MTEQRQVAQTFGRYNLVQYSKLAFVISGLLLLLSIGSLVMKGLNFGIDFTGGTLVELKYSKEANLNQLRSELELAGFDAVQVSYFGSNDAVLVRTSPKSGLSNAQISERIIVTARDATDNFQEMRRVEYVGPQVGEELTNDGGLAVLYALICILIYVAFRFEWRFAIGSVVALAHDVLLTLGLFSLFELNFDLTVLAAVLAIIGYSLNDTIVVFDRIRERFINLRQGTPSEIVNLSVNDMLARTLVTSLTTLLVLISLFFLGGEIIHDFAIALIIGVVIGTYSSVYIAGSLSLLMGIRKEHFQPPEKEGKHQLSEFEMMRLQQQQLAQMQAQVTEVEGQRAQNDSLKVSSSKRKATKSGKSKRKG